MTDNEIIKALDCCTDESYENCNECPYSIDNVSCERMKLLEDSLDLITRQKAEIEKLEKVLNGRDQLVNALNKCYNQAKSEAVKEFATRLEGYSYESMGNYGIIHMVVSVKDVDNLVKEMVGEVDE